MRDIHVNTDVFSMIWSLRGQGEESEDEILRRVLSEKISDLPQKTRAKTPLRKTGDADGLVALAEDVMALQDSVGRVDSHSAWWEIVAAALESLGGEAQLHYIYREVRGICRRVGKKIPKELEATVRGTLEDNCSESHRYKHVRDVFLMPRGKGMGFWGLKKSQR